MKKNILASLLTLVCGTFFFYSCSTKDDVPQVTDETASVTFEFDANTIASGTKGILPTDPVPVPGITLCNTDNVPLSVDIKLTGPKGVVSILAEQVKEFAGVYKTDPYELPAGDYTVNAVTVYNASTSTVIYSGVKSPSTFSPFVPDGYFMDEQKFTLLKYTKPTIPFYVLCAKDYNATDFGMPKFELNRVEVTCFDMFFNVCDKNGEHMVGVGDIKVYDKVGGTLLYQDAFDGGRLDNNGNPETAGNIATLCFADNLTIDNATESYYIVINFTNPNMLSTQHTFAGTATVADLLKFRESNKWDTSMNALHIEVCDETFCLYDNVLCDNCGGVLNENFDRYKDKADFYSRSGWTVPAGQGEQLALVPGDVTNKYLLAVSPADEDKCRKEFSWKTNVFTYVPGHNVRFNMYVKSVEYNGKPQWCTSQPGRDKVAARITVRLFNPDTNAELVKQTKDVDLMGHENDFRLYTAYSMPTPIRDQQCIKAEILVSLRDGHIEGASWVCQVGYSSKYVYYQFGIDDVKSGL